MIHLPAGWYAQDLLDVVSDLLICLDEIEGRLLKYVPKSFLKEVEHIKM